MRLHQWGKSTFAAIAALAVLASSLTTVALSAAPAQAAPTVGFDPANIIDDALFYDGSGMTSAQVQRFLNEKVPRCTLGDKGREVGKKVRWAGNDTKLDSKCLRDKKFNTKNIGADSNCRAYKGASGESAAQIIVKAAKACSINPKVLLITLEKEQSLITDSWPNKLQYERAAGYKCPDTAPCDAGSAGFYRQVVGAAWQLQHYKNSPQYFNFKKGDKAWVQFNPNASCGGSSVTIKNHATAGLYIYTPYQPNKAALKTQWGTGDSCSAYGNRNFYNFWTSWFGSVRANLQITGAIKKVYDAAKATDQPFGDPMSARKKITANGGGYQMVFENGVITTSTKLGKTFGIQNSSRASDAWADAYLASGGAEGPWGFIAGAETPSGYRTLAFQNGTAVANSSTLNRVVYLPKAIYKAWLKNGTKSKEIEAGPYGWPTSDATIRTSSAASQTFERLTIMASGSKLTDVTHDELKQWKALGGQSAIGFYTGRTAVIDANAGTGYRHTDKGTVFFTSKTKQRFLPNGTMRSAYFKAKGPKGSWGWPAGAERAIKGGKALTFTAGTAVYETKVKKTRFLTTKAYKNWVKRGGTKSTIGYPTKQTRTVTDGSYQQYKKHYVFLGPKKTVLLKKGAATKAYFASGGPKSSKWGWPTGSEKFAKNGSSTIKFSKGTVTVSKSGKVKFKKK